jgi:hypothetical protein
MSLPSREISGLNGPPNWLTGPGAGAPSLTYVPNSASTSPVRESFWIFSPPTSAAIVPSSACET